MKLVRTLTRFFKRRKNTMYADAVSEAFKEFFEEMNVEE